MYSSVRRASLIGCICREKVRNILITQLCVTIQRCKFTPKKMHVTCIVIFIHHHCGARPVVIKTLILFNSYMGFSFPLKLHTKHTAVRQACLCGQGAMKRSVLTQKVNDGDSGYCSPGVDVEWVGTLVERDEGMNG